MSYKVKCEFNNVDFNSDLIQMYSEVRSTLAKSFPDDFGIEKETRASKPLKDMTKSEYEQYKSNLEEEQSLIRKGKERVKEKIKNIRQDFSKAVVKGTRSGSGKVLYAHWDELLSIWGAPPSTQPLPFGIESSSVGELSCDNSNTELCEPESSDITVGSSEDSIAESHGRIPSDTANESGTNTVEEINSRKRKKEPSCPTLIDNKGKIWRKSCLQHKQTNF